MFALEGLTKIGFCAQNSDLRVSLSASDDVMNGALHHMSKYNDRESFFDDSRVY